MKLPSFFIIFVLFLLVGCGQKGTNTKLTAKISEEQIQYIMGHQNFDCNSLGGTSCPSGMARLFIINKNDANNSHLCSGFMVGEDTLVTNQHCIPSQATCNNTYVAIYTGFLYVQTKCSKIIKTFHDFDDGDSRKKLDVSIVKLQDKYVGSIFRPASQRPQEGDSISAWVVDHTGQNEEQINPFDARITQFSCRVVHDFRSASLMLENCPIIHGNSGSPALNSSGEFVGVIWGTTADPKKLNAGTPLSERRKKNETAAVTEAIYFKDYLPSK